jgi:heavy metal sensor kinase
MSLKKMLNFKNTLAFRLTAWYAGIFTLSTFLVFLLFYMVIASILQKNRDEDLMVNFKEYSTILSVHGMDSIEKEMAIEASSKGDEKIFLRIFSLKGDIIASTDMSQWPNVPFEKHPFESRLKSGDQHFLTTQTLPQNGHKARIITGVIGSDFILQIGESLEEDDEFLEILRNIFIPIMGLITIVASIAGWFIARRALTGIDDVTETASSIIKGDYIPRVSLKNRGLEIENLAKTFNTMLDRINAVFKEMKATNDNIAHDLRTPLSRIRGAAEMVLTTNISDDENKTAAAGIVEECDRLLSIINTMLDIAEAEAGVAEMTFQTVDLGELLLKACELFEPLVEKDSVRIEKKLSPGCIVLGEPRMLQRMISNLFDNALKYTPKGGSVSISAFPDGNHISMTVSDTGTGIPENDLPFIFKRFFRCDQSRSLPGSGLGLSLVRAIVISHHGDINVSSTFGKGSTFAIFLPTP